MRPPPTTTTFSPTGVSFRRSAPNTIWAFSSRGTGSIQGWAPMAMISASGRTSSTISWVTVVFSRMSMGRAATLAARLSR